MDKLYGFSLTEVLISLFLVSSTALALMTQQWHMLIFFNQLQLHNQAIIEMDSASEDTLLNGVAMLENEFYQLNHLQTPNTTELEINWHALASNTTDKRFIKRTLVVL